MRNFAEVIVCRAAAAGVCGCFRGRESPRPGKGTNFELKGLLLLQVGLEGGVRTPTFGWPLGLKGSRTDDITQLELEFSSRAGCRRLRRPPLLTSEERP